MTLANRITLIRLLLTPVVIIALLARVPMVWPLGIFILAALTDVLDGAVARWRGQQTTLGRFLDPIADKLLLSASFLTLAHLGIIQMWVFIVVFSRDLLILLGWNVIHTLTKNLTLQPRWLGKMSTFSQMTTVILALIAPNTLVLAVLEWSMILCTSLSTVDYLWIGAQKLGELG